MNKLRKCLSEGVIGELDSDADAKKLDVKAVIQALIDDEAEAAEGYDKAALLLVENGFDHNDEMVATMLYYKDDELRHLNGLKELLKKGGLDNE